MPQICMLRCSRLGVREGDALMLHSAFARHHGFNGNIEQLTDAFIEALGPARPPV